MLIRSNPTYLFPSVLDIGNDVLAVRFSKSDINCKIVQLTQHIYGSGKKHEIYRTFPNTRTLGSKCENIEYEG